MHLRYLIKPVCVQYGRLFRRKTPFVSSTASDRKGFVKGEPVPLDRVLLTFARTKVSPRRAGVLIKPFIRLAPPEVVTDFFTNTPPAGDNSLHPALYNIIVCPHRGRYFVGAAAGRHKMWRGEKIPKKVRKITQKRLAKGILIWYTNPCVTALLICDDAGGGRRAAVTTAVQTGNFRGVCPI